MSLRWHATRFSQLMGLAVTLGLLFVASGRSRVHAAVSLDLLYTFTGGLDGTRPSSALIQATDGNFYGTTIGGGAFGFGTIFVMAPGGGLTTLHSFAASEGTSSSVALVQAADGNFYGTGRGAGRADGGLTFGAPGFDNGGTGLGTVFQMTPTGALTVVYRFTGGADGANPAYSLIQARDGTFYGTTNGQNGISTIFKMSSAGEVSPLRTFKYYSDGSPNCLIQGIEGNLYGTTMTGGATLSFGAVSTTPSDAAGTVFKITPSGAFTVLHKFSSNGFRDGTGPVALIQATDRNFYGAATGGGAFAFGTVFKMTPDGKVTVLHAFNGSDGVFPGTLMQAADGNFYGTTIGGGPSGSGTIFRITPTGVFTTLHAFTTSTVGPLTPLLQGRDGNIYGTRDGDARGSPGVVFRLRIAQ